MTFSTALDSVTKSGRNFYCLADGIEGAEGPCTNHLGELYLVNPAKGLVLHYIAPGHCETFVRTGGTPAGLQFSSDGMLWVADMEKGLLGYSDDGQLMVGPLLYQGKPMRGCNDCVIDAAGNIYVTAPAGSSSDNPNGDLFCYYNNGQLVKLDSGFAFCNGIALSHNNKTLIVAETFTKSLIAYDVDKKGALSHRRHWADVDGKQNIGPDGLDFDEDGNLIVANYGGGNLLVFNKFGYCINTITVPFLNPSNIHFAGPDSTILYITEQHTHGLWQYDYGRKGQWQSGWRKYS